MAGLLFYKTSAPPIGRLSVAVLPFAAADADQALLAEGMAEDIARPLPAFAT